MVKLIYKTAIIRQFIYLTVRNKAQKGQLLVW